MRIHRPAKPQGLTDCIFKWAAIIFMISASLIWFLPIYKFFFSPLLPQTLAQAKVTNAIDAMTGETMLSLLGVLAAFGAVVGYIFHEIIKRDIDKKIDDSIKATEDDLKAKIETRSDEIQKVAENVRITLTQEIKERTEEIATLAKKINAEAENALVASGVNAEFASAHTLWTIHYENTKDKSAAEKSQGLFLDYAIQKAKASVNAVNELPHDKKYLDIICICKNNLAFFLAVRGQAEDKKEALNLAKEISAEATGENEKNLKIPHILKVTWALIQLRFCDKDKPIDKPTMKEVHQIVTATLEDSKIAAQVRRQFEERWGYIFSKPFHEILEEIRKAINS